MNVALKPAEKELVITRELKAPRERVFAAWTDPRQAGLWWAPRDFELLSCEMDVRPGGKWSRRMRSAAGTIVAKFGVYRDVTPPERLVFTYRTEEDGVVDPETLVTVILDSMGDGTRLTLRHSRFETDDARLGHQGGWTGALERIAAFLDGR